MKVTTNTNDILEIQANMNKAGDYEIALAIATEIAHVSNFDIAMGDSDQGWICLSGHWNHYQAEEMMDEYTIAKAKVLAALEKSRITDET